MYNYLSAAWISLSAHALYTYMATTFTMNACTCGLSLCTVTVSAEREDGSTPGVRVTWSTTALPECVASGVHMQ